MEVSLINTGIRDIFYRNIPFRLLLKGVRSVLNNQLWFSRAFAPEQLAMMMERFRREAKALAKLNHPNIVKALDYGVHEGAPYLVMEYIDGVTLKDVKKPLRVDAAVRLLRPVAEALEYVHGQGLLHRDIKPSNIMITRDERVILTDFGIVKWMVDEDDPYTLTGTGLGIGTPEYMAPEQGRGQKIDARSDAYSLTVVFYELITGVKPYRGETPVDILIKQANDPIPDPREIVPELNPSVKRFLNCAMAKKPEARYPTMKDYLRDFEGLRLQSLAQAASGNTGIQASPRTDSTTNSSVRFGKTDFRRVREAAGAPSRKNWFRGVGIFAAALLIVGAALLGVLRTRVEPELLPTGTPRIQLVKPEITPTGPSSPTENRPATAAARTASQSAYRETEIVAASIERTEMARGTAIQGTASALADRATELASVSLALTERANAPLETEIASLSVHGRCGFLRGRGGVGTGAVRRDELSGPLRIEAPRHGDSCRHERAAEGGENSPPGGYRGYRPRHRGDGPGGLCPVGLQRRRDHARDRRCGERRRRNQRHCRHRGGADRRPRGTVLNPSGGSPHDTRKQFHGHRGGREHSSAP